VFLRSVEPRARQRFPQLPGNPFLSGPVAISFREMAAGTGLGKTAVISAVKEALKAGIIKHELHQKGTRASKYTID